MIGENQGGSTSGGHQLYSLCMLMRPYLPFLRWCIRTWKSFGLTFIMHVFSCMCLVELKPPRCASCLFGEVQQFPDKGKHMFQHPEAPPRMVNITVVGTYPQIISAVSTFMKYDLEKKRTSIINMYSLNIVFFSFSVQPIVKQKTLSVYNMFSQISPKFSQISKFAG